MGHLDAAGAGNIALRTLVVYGVLLLGVRFSGKREIGQMTPFDLVVLLLISNAVQNAMTGPDTSVMGGVVAASTLLIVNLSLAKISYRLPALRRFVDGIPILLVAHGEPIYPNLKREGISFDELMGALREHECGSLDQVEMAMLEIDGDISVIRRDRKQNHVMHSRKRLVRHTKKP